MQKIGHQCVFFLPHDEGHGGHGRERGGGWDGRRGRFAVEATRLKGEMVGEGAGEEEEEEEERATGPMEGKAITTAKY